MHNDISYSFFSPYLSLSLSLTLFFVLLMNVIDFMARFYIAINVRKKMMCLFFVGFACGLRMCECVCVHVCMVAVEFFCFSFFFFTFIKLCMCKYFLFLKKIIKFFHCLCSFSSSTCFISFDIRKNVQCSSSSH